MGGRWLGFVRRLSAQSGHSGRAVQDHLYRGGHEGRARRLERLESSVGEGSSRGAYLIGRGERSGGHTFQLNYSIVPAAGMLIEVA